MFHFALPSPSSRPSSSRTCLDWIPWGWTSRTWWWASQTWCWARQNWCWASPTWCCTSLTWSGMGHALIRPNLASTIQLHLSSVTLIPECNCVQLSTCLGNRVRWTRRDVARQDRPRRPRNNEFLPGVLIYGRYSTEVESNVAEAFLQMTSGCDVCPRGQLKNMSEMVILK